MPSLRLSSRASAIKYTDLHKWSSVRPSIAIWSRLNAESSFIDGYGPQFEDDDDYDDDDYDVDGTMKQKHKKKNE